MTLYLSQKKLLILLLSAFAAGFLLAALYDLFRLLRYGQNPDRKIFKALYLLRVSLEDFLFFVFCGVVFAILFFVTNSGKVRPSAFLMALFGFLFFRLTLSRLTFPLLVSLATLGKRIVFKILHFVLCYLLLPPIKGLRYLFRRLFAALSLRRRKRKTRKLLSRLAGLGTKGYAQGLRHL